MRKRGMARVETRESNLWDGLDEDEHATFLKLVRTRMKLTLDEAAELARISSSLLYEIEIGHRKLYQFAFEAILKTYHDEEIRRARA